MAKRSAGTRKGQPGSMTGPPPSVLDLLAPPLVPPGPRRYTFTRDQLIDALTRLEAYPAPRSDGKRSFIVAESMADALIEALEDST